MDRTKYRRLMPVYIANRLALKETDPEIWDAEDLHDFSESDSDAGFEN